ncbi:MAG: hypothetical protein U5P10_11640 [Spirochaetia bacterium]|nr:hypothetical protein [Spirochaetia bacterium]
MQQRSIRGKVVTAITLLLLISVAVSIVIAVTNQRNAILDTQKRNLITSNDILNSVIQNLMLSGEAPLAVNTMDDLTSESRVLSSSNCSAATELLHSPTIPL